MPLITQFTIDDLMHGSLVGARASDPVVPVRTTRRPRLFRYGWRSTPSSRLPRVAATG